ncbi:MAG: ROK family protein [Solirubrobacterales bacterium]|nr:ROK family protein [Solirubrobacterales bacterium]
MLVGVLDPAGVVVHRRMQRSAGLSGEEVLGVLEAELRLALETRPGVEAIGLGAPCTMDRERGVCVSAVNLPLRDVPIRELVAERIGLPVFVDNDANTAVIAEHRRGVAQGARNVVMLTIGTGIGGGLIIDGRPYRGSSGAGAELGHVVVDLDGPPCQGSCPNHGCIESIASGTALGNEAARAAGLAPDSGLGIALAEGRRIDGRLVTDLGIDGDRVAIGVLEIIGRRLGAALSGLANVFDPDVIVIGGGVIAAGDLLLEPARDEFRSRALTPQRNVPIEAAAFGPDAGMVGAALMASEELASATGVGG